MGTFPRKAASLVAQPCSLGADVSVVSPASSEGSLAFLLWPPWSRALPCHALGLLRGWAACPEEGPQRWATRASFVHQLVHRTPPECTGKAALRGAGQSLLLEASVPPTGGESERGKTACLWEGEGLYSKKVGGEGAG